MKKEGHPAYRVIQVQCSCGNHFETRSTYRQELLKVEACNACHPFFTGKHRIIDTAGRVDRFMQRYGSYQRPASESTEAGGAAGA